jgi:hypothetical protein
VTSLAPEEEVLFLCARLNLSPEEAGRLRVVVDGPLDGEALLALARRHGLIGFLHRNLAGVALPEGLEAELSEAHRHNVHRALRLSRELRRLAEALEARGIQSLAYKGPAQAVQVYGDLALRYFVDLDLLVLPADMPAAGRVLGECGYDPHLELTPGRETLFNRVDGDRAYLHRATGLLVELHARVSSLRFAMPVETEALFGGAAEIRVGGGEVRAPGPDDLLMVLCIHGAKHRWKRLEWLVAVAELARSGRADPARCLERSAALGARRTVLLGFALARRLLGLPLPPALAAAAGREPGLEALCDEAEARLRGPEPEEETAANLRFNLAARDSRGDQLLYAWRWATIPGPEDWAWLSLPDRLLAAYRVVRPLRLLMRYLPRRPR